MSRRYNPHLSNTSDFPHPNTALPIDRPVAVYYRQSTESQVGNVSTYIQTVDMVAHLKARGWQEEQIHLIDMDEGVSGSKKIDERAGMRLLFTLICEGQIGAVACQDEDRLFRDVTQIQVNIFIEACRASSVIVLTPSMVYDFANEMTGTFHARQFRLKSEMAAEYINSFIRGRLHKAKKRMAMEGRWVGGSIPVGFMVDMRKTLANGSANDQWRRYVPFAPYADVINRYFNVFLQTGGNFAATIRRIYDEHIKYPDPLSTPPPEGFKVQYGLTRRSDGYYPGRSALANILTNVAYIGHWAVNDVVVQWDNHTSIVPLNVFMRAFNYRSEYQPNGDPNTPYRPYKQFSRPTLDENRPIDRPLCAGMIVSEIDGLWYNVGTQYVKRGENYKYILCTPNRSGGIDEQYVWSKRSDWIDEAVVKRLHAKLRVTFDSDVWQQTLAKAGETLQQQHRLKISQLTALERTMQNLVAGIETLSSPQMIRAVEFRYEEAKSEYDRLKADLDSNESESQRLGLLEELRNNYESTLTNWDTMMRDEKCVLLQSFIERIEATPDVNHSLRLVIRWRDQSYDTMWIPRLPTKGDGWTYEETETMAALLDHEASQVEIAAAFPDRKWKPIRDKIFRMRGKKAALFTPKPIRDFETYHEYVGRVGSQFQVAQKARHKWRADELQLLLRMLDSGATIMDIARAFPYRKWTHTRTKVSSLKGHDFIVTGDKPMRSAETYYMYETRTQAEHGEALSCDSSNMGSSGQSMMTGRFLRCCRWREHRRA